MPDETSPSPQQSPSQLSTQPPMNSEVPTQAGNDLEALFQQAEQAAVIPVNRQPKPCEHSASSEINVYHTCPTCLWPFCVDCGSPIDPTYCKLCLNEPDANLKEMPLVDADGERHEGRLLIPDGPQSIYSPPRFRTLTQTISTMDEHELEDYISHYKNLVVQAEKALDFRRIVLGTSQLELNQRQDAKRRKLQSDKQKFPVKMPAGVDPKTGKQKTVSAGATQLMAMLLALDKKIKDRKEKK